MSDQFYSYLSNKLFDYFNMNPLLNGDKFYIQFDEKDQIIEFYNNIEEYAKDNNLYEKFEYTHKDGDEFSSYSVKCGEIKLVIVESTSLSENYLVTLRNQVGKSNEYWENTALFVIFDEANDSVFDGMGNLANKGMPLNINSISKKLEDEISNSKDLDKASKEIIRFSLKNLKEDIFQTTIWDYRSILAIIKSGEITSDNLKDLKLFPDKSLKEHNAHKMKSRLQDNYILFEEIENFRRYGDFKEELKKSFSDNGVKVLSDDEWYLTDYKDVKDYKKKAIKEPLTYEENPDKKTLEGLTYWEKPLSTTPAGRRKRHIIVFNNENASKVSFLFSFDKRIKNEFLKGKSKNIANSSGKKLKVEFEVSTNKPTFKQVSYKHDGENNSHYFFNILVLNSDKGVFDSIKSRYAVEYNKKRLSITNDEDSDDVIFGIGENKIEIEIEDKNEKIMLFDEDNIIISENSPAWEEGSLNFELVYNENSIPIQINEKSKKAVPVKSSVIWNLKRQNRENFTYNGVKAIQGVNSVNLDGKFKQFLNLERQIIKNNIYYGIKEIDGSIEKQDVEFSEELTNAYDAIFEYYKTFDNTPEDNLPSLVYLNDELKELYENFLEIFNREISEIKDNDILADYKYKKDLIKLGRIDDDNKIMYSSLSPINIAYQLEISNQCGSEELANNLAERLVPNNLIPYIYSDLNELYRPIYQEQAHEWLIYEKSEDVSIGTTNAFISNVVNEKLNQFVKHFGYLFEINSQAPIKINLININDDIEVVKGIFNFIRDKLPDKVKTKNIIPVEINIYNDSDRSSFETLFNCNSKDEIDNIFGIKIKSDLLDSMDVIRLIQNNIEYYHHSLNEDYGYAHISFYKVTSDMEPVSDNMDKMETGLSLNGLISTVASTTKHSDYRSGFGTRNILDKENTLVKSAININELIENSKNKGKHSYSKNKVVVTSVTLDDENIELLYDKSHWVTFIEPTFGIEYFDNPNDLVLIHYSDQYTSSNKYDTITVTKKSTQYELTILQFLKEKGIDVSDLDLKQIIRMFNSINGEWLLKIVSSSGEFDREKLSLISAVKYSLSILDHEDIIWIPVSLEEILRITKNLKLDKAKGIISAFVKQGSYNDDLLLIGLKMNNDEIEIIYHPVEVKIGNNDATTIKKGKSQIDSTSKLLKQLFDVNSPKFVNKFFRNFFIQLFLSNQQKLLANEIWNEKDFERIEKYKSKLLNDEYTIIYDLEEIIGIGSLFSFKSDCSFTSLTKVENKQIVELPEEYAYVTIAKSVNELCYEIQNGESDLQVNDLLSQVDLDSIERKKYSNFDDGDDTFFNSDLDEDDFSSDNDSAENDLNDSSFDGEFADNNFDDGSGFDGDSVDIAFDDSDDGGYYFNDSSNDSDLDIGVENESVEDGNYDLKNVRALIGTVNGSNHEIYWEFGSSEINNRHLLIQGASGYGKSYFIQKMLKELSIQGIPSIIVDYTDGFRNNNLEPAFKESLGDNIEQNLVMFNKFSLNPFKKYLIEYDGEYYPEDNVTIASRFKDILNTVYSFGDQQEMAIYNAVMNGLSKFGDEMDLIKFKEELINLNTPPANSALSKLTQFLDINPFKTEDFDWSCLDEFNGKVRIIQLTGLSKDIQRIVTEFILLDLWNYKLHHGDKNKPFIVVLDEAQNLDFGEKSPCGKILVEGRKFGWSGWFATQFVKGAMKSDEINRLENAGEKIYFHPNDNSISDVASKLSKDNKDKQFWEQKLSKLNKGQCIVHGHLKNSQNEIYPADPIGVDVSAINVETQKDNSNETADENIDTKFIKRAGNKFEIYKTINGKKKYYGRFNTIEEAIKKRDELVEDNWGYSYDELPSKGKTGKYGKNIIQHNGYFKVSKTIDGKQRFIGSFKTVEEARELRDLLILNNWDLTKIPSKLINSPNEHKNKYIKKFNDEYVVSKKIDGEVIFFGRFKTLEEAIEYRNYLIDNNWQINPEIEEEKIDEFVYLINDKFVVRNQINGEMKIFGRFNDMGEAIQFRNYCVRNNWKQG